MSCEPNTLDVGIAVSFTPSHNECGSGARMHVLAESKSVPYATALLRNRALVAGQIRWQRIGRKCFSSWNRTRIRRPVSSWRSSKLDIQIDTALAICVLCSGGSGFGGSRRCSV